MHYANEKQLSALKELGFTPTEDKTTLTEVAQYLFEKYAVEIEYDCIDKHSVWGVFYTGTNIYEAPKEKELPTISEALSWAIDQAIKYLQENAKQ